ncbi:MAG: class I SAM-dependent methyltransferase [Pyrinomonadaceae bacterium]
MSANVDKNVVAGFGDEWSRFDQSELDTAELQELFENYFSIFPWDKLPPHPVGFDLGCGSGRWARLVAPRVGKLYLFDPSPDALAVAKRSLAAHGNCEFEIADAGNIPLPENSCDFGYSLGVLHHIPDTQAGLRECVSKLKPGAPFLLYLYYSFDNRPAWFRVIWLASDLGRQTISRMPHKLRYLLSQLIAISVYLPLARTSLLMEKAGINVDQIPLSQYRQTSLYTMRTDALDRFGTRLEKRFSKVEIEEMMSATGLRDITFSTRSFWTAVGYKVNL